MFPPHLAGYACRRRGPNAAASKSVIASLAMMMILLGSAAPGRADSRKGIANGAEVDTEHLFGFIEGSDIGAAGEKELEVDSTVRSGRSSGSFDDAASAFEFKYTAFRNFRISAAATFAYYDIAGVTGMEDRREGAFQSLSFDARFRLLEREHSPFGLTLSIDPHWGFADETSGAPISHFGWEGVLVMDRELAPDRLFGALNLHFDADRTESVAGGSKEQQPTLGIGGALAGQAISGVWIGGEVRYFRSYEGAGLDKFTGHAVYVGPTLYARFGEKAWLSAAFDVQAWGRAVTSPGALDLVNFERYQAKFRLGYDF
jgi:hypothetical protein